MKLTVRETAVFGFLGTLMFTSKLVMEILPNVHLIAMFITAITVVYRWKALFPIYVFVILTGLYAGFNMWWIPYLYIWTVLWGIVMLLPKKIPPKIAPAVYSAVCAIHGLSFGALYAPAQALMFGYSFDQMIKWIIVGLPYDAIHGVSNLLCGFLTVPLVTVMRRFERS